jgi:hypothetical protein
VKNRKLVFSDAAIADVVEQAELLMSLNKPIGTAPNPDGR